MVMPEQVLNVMRGLELAVASSQQRRVVPWITAKSESGDDNA